MSKLDRLSGIVTGREAADAILDHCLSDDAKAMLREQHEREVTKAAALLEDARQSLVTAASILDAEHCGDPAHNVRLAVLAVDAARTHLPMEVGE